MKSRVFQALSFVAVLAICAQSSAAQEPRRSAGGSEKVRKPQMSDTLKINVYADNWFVMYINGEMVAVDSINFIPHNVISVDYLPTYPMTIAVMAKDNADPKTGMEYANTNVGDGGLCIKFSDGTVTNANWRAKSFSRGPIGGDTQQPKVQNEAMPENWFAIDFDDSQWSQATEYASDDVGPKQPFFEHDFANAKFIWTEDLKLDNTVVFRCVVKSPPDGKKRTDFSNLNNVVPEQPARGPRSR